MNFLRWLSVRLGFTTLDGLSLVTLGVTVLIIYLIALEVIGTLLGLVIGTWQALFG